MVFIGFMLFKRFYETIFLVSNITKIFFSLLYLDCDVLLQQVTDIMGIPVLRLVIPDKWNRMPMQSEPPFIYQMLATHLLYHSEKQNG